MVKVFLLKEEVHTIDENLIPSFRKLCEQVGYRTHYNQSNYSLYLKPWLDGKRFIIQLENQNKKEILSRLEQLLAPYGADIDTSITTKGDLFFLLQFSNQDHIEIQYFTSHNEGEKELAKMLHHSLLEHFPEKNIKLNSLWKPFANEKQKKLLAKIHSPAVVLNLPHVISTEEVAQSILRTILTYYHVPILLPQNQAPEVWEGIILQVLEINKQKMFEQPQPEPDIKNVKLEEKHEPEIHETEFKDVKTEEKHIAEVKDKKEEKSDPLPPPKIEPIPVESFSPFPSIQNIASNKIQSEKSPAQIIQERIKELQSKGQHSVQKKQAKNQPQPAWKQFAFAKKSTNPNTQPIIDPFNKKQSKKSNAALKTIDPFRKGR
jgi:hypothetical protein